MQQVGDRFTKLVDPLPGQRGEGDDIVTPLGLAKHFRPLLGT